MRPYFPHWVIRNDTGGDPYPDVLLNALPASTIIGVHHLDDDLPAIRRLLDFVGTDGTPKQFQISWYAESNVKEPRDPARSPVVDRIKQAAAKQAALRAETIAGQPRYPAERFADLIELDAARERSKKVRTAHAQAVKSAGLRYLAKSLGPAQIDELRNDPDLGRDFVPRVVFEDVVHDAEYQADAIALASRGEILTLVIHQGAYDGDRGTPLKRARAFVAAKVADPGLQVEAWHGKPAADARSVKTLRLKPFTPAEGGEPVVLETKAAPRGPAAMGGGGTTRLLPIKLNGTVKPLTGVFVPRRFRAGAEVDFVVYLHGNIIAACMTEPALFLSRGIEYYLTTPLFACLRDELEASGVNAILVAPTLGVQFGSMSPAWAPRYGNLDEDGKFDFLLGEVMSRLKADGTLPATAQPRRIVLAGHSAGGAPMLKILAAQNTLLTRITECWGFECLYFGAAGWKAWLKANPTKAFRHFRQPTEQVAAARELATRPNFTDVATGTRHCTLLKDKWREAIDASTALQRAEGIAGV